VVDSFSTAQIPWVPRGVVTGEVRGQLSTVIFGCQKIVGIFFLFEKFLSKNENFGAENPHSEEN